MIPAREILNTTGQVRVTCDNPAHPDKRFSTVALAESYVLGNAVMGDCLSKHAVSEPMRDLGVLLASLMPVEGDDDFCERGL